MAALPDLTCRTDRMTLRALTCADEEEFVRTVAESREAWAPWTPAASPTLTAADLYRHELERTERSRAAGTHLRLAAFEAAGRLVGLFALNEIVRGVFQSAYASWQVRTGFEGRGLGTEGAHALVDIAFASPPRGIRLHRVQANVMPANVASVRVAEKVGFRREGVAVRYLRIAGSWADHVMFAVTAEEWGER